jgi:hypothetical protein
VVVLLAFGALAAALAAAALLGPELLWAWRCRRALVELEACDLAARTISPYWRRLLDSGEEAYPLLSRLLLERDLGRWSRLVRVLDASLEREAFCRYLRDHAPAALASYLLHPAHDERSRWRREGESSDRRGRAVYWRAADPASDAGEREAHAPALRFLEELVRGERLGEGPDPAAADVDRESLVARGRLALIAQLPRCWMALAELEQAPWSRTQRRIVRTVLLASERSDAESLEAHSTAIGELLEDGIFGEQWQTSEVPVMTWDLYSRFRPERLTAHHRDLARALDDRIARVALVHLDHPRALSILARLARFPEDGALMAESRRHLSARPG